MLLVILFSRPERLSNVRSTIGRHKGPVLIVEGKKALGTFPKTDRVEVRSAEPIGTARNVGLDLARERGIEWVTYADDDDYYGPGYFSEIEEEIGKNDVDVLHKGLHFVRFDDGLYAFEPRPSELYNLFQADGLTVRVSSAPRFPEVPCGEEGPFTRFLRHTKARERVLSPWGHIYNRTGVIDDHAYRGTKTLILRSHGIAHFVGDVEDAWVDQPKDISTLPLVEIPTEDAMFEDLRQQYQRLRRISL